MCGRIPTVEELDLAAGAMTDAENSVIRAALKFDEAMTAFDGELRYCSEAMEAVFDTTDRLRKERAGRNVVRARFARGLFTYGLACVIVGGLLLRAFDGGAALLIGVGGVLIGLSMPSRRASATAPYSTTPRPIR